MDFLARLLINELDAQGADATGPCKRVTQESFSELADVLVRRNQTNRFKRNGPKGGPVRRPLPRPLEVLKASVTYHDLSHDKVCEKRIERRFSRPLTLS